MFGKLMGSKKEGEEKPAESSSEAAENPDDFMSMAMGDVSASSDGDGDADDESLDLGLGGNLENDDVDNNSLDSGRSFEDEHSIASLAYKDEELKRTHVTINVDYWEVESALAMRHMYRKDDEVYRAACGVDYELSLYPFIPSKADGVYRLPMMRLSRYIKAVQVRRIVLSDQINATAQEVRKFDDLNALCDKKLAAKEVSESKPNSNPNPNPNCNPNP
jgi:hypothetical protein